MFLFEIYAKTSVPASLIRYDKDVCYRFFVISCLYPWAFGLVSF